MNSDFPSDKASEAALVDLRHLSEDCRADSALLKIQDRKNSFQRFFLEQYLDNRLSLPQLQFSKLNDPATLCAEELRILLFTLNQSARVRSVSANRIIFEAPELKSFPAPPAGYGYKGGAARLALRALLGEDVSRYIPRDLDLFRIGNGESQRDKVVAKRYSPEDFQHGHGIELVRSIDDYLATRDIRFNEILFFENELICSPYAVMDMLRAELHPTTNLIEQHGETLPGNIQMKMLRMCAESELEGIPYTLCYKIRPEKIKAFDIALHLDRIVARGSRAIEIYLKSCASLGLLGKGKTGRLSFVEAVSELEQSEPGIRGAFPGLMKCKAVVPLRDRKLKRIKL